MKIITITSNDLGISWGPAIHFLELWTEFCALKSDFEIEGIAPSWTDNKIIKKINFKLILIKIPNIRVIRQIIYDFRVTLLLIKKRKFVDLIYVRHSHWHFLQIMFLFLTKKPFVVEFNGLSNEDSISAGRFSINKWLIEWQERWFVKNTKLGISVSDGIRDALINRYEPIGIMTTIPNGVSRNFFIDGDNIINANERLKGIYVGTFTPWDGAVEIVKLAKKFYNIDFIMVGDGYLRNHIQSTAGDNVKFLGQAHYSSLPNIYKKCDFGIILYEFERHRKVRVSSLKTLEYVASELPVFCTGVNGQEYIEEMGFGVLVAEGESPEEKFEQFLNNLSKYSYTYRAARKNLPLNYGWEKTAHRTLEEIIKINIECQIP